MLKQARKVREAAQAALNQQFAGVMAEFEQRISEAEVKGKMSAYFSVKCSQEARDYMLEQLRLNGYEGTISKNFRDSDYSVNIKW